MTAAPFDAAVHRSGCAALSHDDEYSCSCGAYGSTPPPAAGQGDEREALANVLLDSWKSQGGLHPPFDTDMGDALQDADAILSAGWSRAAQPGTDALAEAWDAGWRAGRGRGPGHTDACPIGGGRHDNPFDPPAGDDSGQP